MVRAKAKQQAAFIVPMAAQPVAALPEGDQWRYEPKLDGYRALIVKNGTAISVLSRNEKDLTRMYPAVAAAGQRLKAKQAVVDGEIVAVDEKGVPSFQALQHRAKHPKHEIVFYAFDALHRDGRDLTDNRLLRGARNWKRWCSRTRNCAS